MLITTPNQFRKFRKILRKRRLYSHWIAKGLLKKAYHFVKALRLKQIEQSIHCNQRKEDIGAGTGDFLSVAKMVTTFRVRQTKTKSDCKK
jgi:hypothetical protein